MAEFSLKKWTKLSTDRKAEFGNLLLKSGLRLIAAVAMAVLLLLHREWPVPGVTIFGTVLLALIGGLMLRAQLSATELDRANRQKLDRLVWATSLLAVAGTQVANLAMRGNPNPGAEFLLMAPLVAQSMLVAALARPGVSLVGLSMSVLMLGIAGSLPIDLAAGTWLAGAIAAHTVNPLKQRSDLIRAMSIQVLVQSVVCASMTMVMPQMTSAPWAAAIWGAIAAVIATAVFWLGVAVLEKIFGIVSDWTLLELCSPEQPLLRQLVLQAPGTYAHSVGVANLAEAAAREVGANPLLSRTMAYYHDIGKTARPNFFIENQLGSNIHNEISPSLSAQIIAAHVTDGVDLARSNKLPQVIVDGIAQHHGTSLITFFYHRAIEETGQQASGELERKFRYPGPKPQTKESAILHLADVVEAASRVMPAEQSLDLFVTNLIEKSRADGQLDESELTFKDLGVIGESFCQTLRALRHERVQYPVETPIQAVTAPIMIDQGEDDLDEPQSDHRQSTRYS
jgi:hypothetical protein